MRPATVLFIRLLPLHAHQAY